RALEVTREAPDETRDRPREGIAGAVEHLLRLTKDGADVARAPSVREVPGRGLRPRRDERFDVSLGHLRARAPPGEPLDFAVNLVEVVADELDEEAARLGLCLGLVELELVCDPARQRARGDVPDEDVPGRRYCLGDRGVFLQLGAD